MRPSSVLTLRTLSGPSLVDCGPSVNTQNISHPRPTVSSGQALRPDDAQTSVARPVAALIAQSEQSRRAPKKGGESGESAVGRERCSRGGPRPGRRTMGPPVVIMGGRKDRLIAFPESGSKKRKSNVKLM